MGVLVGRKAPNFIAKAVVNGKIVENYTLEAQLGKKVLLFFYPLDFTFVCPTELHAFQEALKQFEARGCTVIGCSVDSVFSHLAWVQTPKAKGGIEGVTYPLISDLNKTIARDYDVLVPNEGVAFRALFLIDEKGMVFHQLVNALPLGRSVDEALRTLDAQIFFENNGEVCPANWSKGKKGFKADLNSLQDYVAEVLSSKATAV
ncbi:MAG: redoxin domain-containing protein [Verrucomicrobia bacterium]|nr:redoxin domain-containing protein [Verrucomicrobiota bacterium]MBS0636576.1 redoxin domain-containing protein [Verrucomicrobiota bacterium]